MFQQIVFGQDLTLAFNEQEQQIEIFRLEGHNLAVAPQQAFTCIQTERAELVKMCGWQTHNRDKKK